jgi:RNA polymerase sigma factor (sigma-70 family)
MVRWCLTPLGQQIVDENRGLAAVAALRFPWKGMPREDLKSSAFIGLCCAAATFNPRLQVAFSTYVHTCCWHQMCDDYRRYFFVPLPRHIVRDGPPEHLRERVRQTRWICLRPSEILADRILDPHELEPADPDPRLERLSLIVHQRLSKRERGIVLGRAEGRTLRSLGAELGISRERVRQIELAAYRRIRTMMGVGVS